MMRGLAESMVESLAEVATSVTLRQYLICLVHLIICVALIATMTPGDESLVLGGLSISREVQWAFGAFNCVSLVVIILAAVGNLYYIEPHLMLYYYGLLVSIGADIALLAMFAIAGAVCNPTNHFSSQVECRMLGGQVSVILLLFILFKVIGMMTASRTRKLIRNKNNEDLLPLLKDSLGASLVTDAKTSETFKPSPAPAARPVTATAKTARMGAAEDKLLRPRVIRTEPPMVRMEPSNLVTSYDTTTATSASFKGRVLTPDFVMSAPPQVTTGPPPSSTINLTVPVRQIPAVSMPLPSRPIPSSLAHIGPTEGQRPILEVSSERLLEPSEPDALCPALILTRGESEVHFTITLASIERLSFGEYPVEILGPSGRTLLHARLPSSPSVGPQDTSAGLWLELCTTPDSRFPHGSIGPLFPGIRAEHNLEIRGPSGQVFAEMEPSESGWCVVRRGRALFNLDADPSTGSFRTTEAPDAALALASPATEDTLQVQMAPGVDALLNLVSLLAAILMSFGRPS